MVDGRKKKQIKRIMDISWHRFEIMLPFFWNCFGIALTCFWQRVGIMSAWHRDYNCLAMFSNGFDIACGMVLLFLLGSVLELFRDSFGISLVPFRNRFVIVLELFWYRFGMIFAWRGKWFGIFWPCVGIMSSPFRNCFGIVLELL